MKSSVSIPVPPSKLSAPEFPTRISFPAPPKWSSSPLPPLRMLSALLPVRMLSPLPAMIFSIDIITSVDPLSNVTVSAARSKTASLLV